MNVLAPALIFSALASKDFDVDANGLLMLGSVGVVLGSGLLAWPIARWLHVDYRTFVPPMMFNNCGNMGLPLAVLAFGQAGFSAMVALFTISNLLHFTLGVWIIDHHARFGQPAAQSDGVVDHRRLRVRAHPSAAAGMGGESRIKMVGDALIPMMLLSLGVRLVDVRWSDWRIGVIGGLVCPLTGIAMAALLAPRRSGSTRRSAGLLILFGCLPPAVLNFMVAEQFRQEPAQGRVDRADRQRDVRRVRAARARARAQMSPGSRSAP